jgi:hypothetical protein
LILDGSGVYTHSGEYRFPPHGGRGYLPLSFGGENINIGKRKTKKIRKCGRQRRKDKDKTTIKKI